MKSIFELNSEPNVPPKHIAQLVGPQYGITGDSLKDQLQIFIGLHTEKLLEKEDRNELINLGRRGAKLAMLSLFCSALANRMVTQLKFRNFDFMNLRLFIRFPIRMGIFFFFFTNMVFLPMTKRCLELNEQLNNKYYPRMVRFVKENDPLIMNPNYLNEPGMTEEEKEYMSNYYNKLKTEIEMRKMEEKMKGGRMWFEYHSMKWLNIIYKLKYINLIIKMLTRTNLISRNLVKQNKRLIQTYGAKTKEEIVDKIHKHNINTITMVW